MTGWVRIWGVIQALIIGALLCSPWWAASPIMHTLIPSDGSIMRAFTSEGQLDARLRPGIRPMLSLDASAPAMMDVAEPAAAEAAAAPETITNNQSEGVDEGGIVKRRGDILVMLRRGRLFTVSTADNGLRAVDRINAFPGDPSSTPDGIDGAWYDEMLVAGDMVVVIGFSYARQGTEINRFRLSDDGRLTYRDTHHIRSADYYSDRNYASRLIGDKLVVYAPLPIARSGREALPAIAKWTGSAQRQRFLPYADFSDVHLADPYWTGNTGDFDTLHSVSTCDLTADDLACSAQVILGNWSRSFYVSANAVYIWTGDARDGDQSDRAMLYRMPLDGGTPQAVQVAGNPIDQFSFREEDGVLYVLTQGDGDGDAMFAPESSAGYSLALLRLPLSAFASGTSAAEAESYRMLPKLEAYGIQNRYVGGHLVYAGSESRSEGNAADLPAFAVPVAGGAITRLAPGHAVTRIDKMGNDAVLIGKSRDDSLFFSTVRLTASPAIADRFRLPGASEGENRSHAFSYRPDMGSPDGLSGMLGLPITRRRGGSDGRFLGSSGAILFLRRDNRILTRAGELTAEVGDIDDACLASCVDWYGNARPIFADARIFALMGYELVEGQIKGDRISELRRLDFTLGRLDRRPMTKQ